MKKFIVFLLSAMMAFSPMAAMAQCVVPANGAVVKATDYAPLAADSGKLFLMNCSIACSVTLPGTVQSPVWMIWVETIGAGKVTIVRNGRTLNGVAADIDLPMVVGSTVQVMTDGSDYTVSFGASLRAYRYRTCDIVVGDTSGSALTNAQLGPQKRLCFLPANATVVEVDVEADAGTPNVIVGYRNPAGTLVNILSGALATGAAGVNACSNSGGTTGLDGATTCTNTLQNTAVVTGGYLELVSGTAGGTAKLMTIHIIYLVN